MMTEPLGIAWGGGGLAFARRIILDIQLCSL